MRPVDICEHEIREIIREELAVRETMNEGFWDDVSSGAKKLSAIVAKFASKLGLSEKAKAALSKMTEMPEWVTSVVAIVKQAMQETGESFSLDETLKLAKDLGAVDKQTVENAVIDDMKGPVHDKAQSMSESAMHESIEALLDVSIALDASNKPLNESKEKLNEAGLISAVGMGLALLGGITMLLQGLEKLARTIGAEKTAAFIGKAHHVAHAVEEKVIDWVVPDVLSFALYNYMWKKGVRFAAQKNKKRQLTREEYSSNVDSIRHKVEKIVYSALLVYFAWNGIKAAINAGISLLGVAEGTATAIKGAEIGTSLAQVIDAAKLAAEA